MTYPDVVRLAEAHPNLTTMPVTASGSSYPLPETGMMFLGFRSDEERYAFAEAHGGELALAEWRDGWRVCHYRGDRKPFGPDEEDFCRNDGRFSVFATCADADAYIFSDNFDVRIASDMAEDDGLEWDDISEDAKAHRIDVARRSLRLLLPIGWDDTKDVAVYDGANDCWELYPKNSMSFAHDTRNAELGVYFEYTEEEGGSHA